MKTNIFCENLFWKSLYVAVCAIFTMYIGLFQAAATAYAWDDIGKKTETPELPPGFVDDELLDETFEGSAKDEAQTQPQGQTQTFIISAYYSPLQGQAKYVTGSYAGDIRLNGGGKRGADGTDVYPGMVAAPKSYAFGTKMLIPGIGTVAVHDRGGAIVHGGERGNSYDRLDIWMGYGDAGLKRALKWGKRTVEVTVYGVNPDIKEEVYLEGYSEDEKHMVANTLTFNNDVETAPAVVQSAPSFSFDSVLSAGSSGEQVKKLQEKLRDNGYYAGEINGLFDENTANAVKKYQVAKNIVTHENAYGAGYVGPKTVRVLVSEAGAATAHAAQESVSVSEVFMDDLKSGDSGDSVRLLQQELKRMHLFGIEPTGIYGELTEHAVFKFQQINALAGGKDSPGAGIFGPITRKTLNAIVEERERTEKLIADRRKDEQ